MAMPRFFLHQRTRHTVITDPEGSDLPDLSAALDEAMASARQLIAEAVLRGIDTEGTAFDIADPGGKWLASLAFRDALPPSLCASPGEG